MLVSLLILEIKLLEGVKTVRNKITWNMVLKDFKAMHPSLSKEVSYWRPHNYSTIVIYLKKGNKITYNYDTKEITFLKDDWKK